MEKNLLYLLLVLFISSQGMAQVDTVRVDTTSVQNTIVSVNEPVTSAITPSTPSVPKHEPYQLKLATDIPVTAVTTITTLYGFSKIYSKDPLTMEELASLNRNNVPRFDRSSLDNFDEKWTKVGDYMFYGSMPLPILFLFDKNTRKDFVKLATLYLEAMGVTGITYVSAVYFGDRYRPYAYNPEVPVSMRTRGGARNSFFAGHPALVGTATFFMATVFSDYYPESKSKWLFYTLAAAATGTTAMARYKGGRHFPSDILIGITLGPLSGILIPKIHKRKDLTKRKTALMPFFGESNGLVLVHKF